MKASHLETAFKEEVINKQALKILSLEKENKDLQEKVVHLESMMVGNASLSISLENNIPQEVIICEQQVKLLHDISANGIALTQEQAKKLEIYVKILSAYGAKKQGEDKDKALDDIPTEDLTQALTLVRDRKSV